jgi:hypothetical protein
VYVGRPSIFGNPYHSGFDWPKGLTITKTPADLVALYDGWVIRNLTVNPRWLAPLRGHDLACWCKTCELHADGRPAEVACPDCPPCHADILLTLANR